MLARQSKTIEAILPPDDIGLGASQRPEVVVAAFTHAPIFDVLGVKPALGRGFARNDEPLSMAILSHTHGQEPSAAIRMSWAGSSSLVRIDWK